MAQAAPKSKGPEHTLPQLLQRYLVKGARWSPGCKPDKVDWEARRKSPKVSISTVAAWATEDTRLDWITGHSPHLLDGEFHHVMVRPKIYYILLLKLHS